MPKDYTAWTRTSLDKGRVISQVSGTEQIPHAALS